MQVLTIIDNTRIKSFKIFYDDLMQVIFIVSFIMLQPFSSDQNSLGVIQGKVTDENEVVISGVVVSIKGLNFAPMTINGRIFPFN